MKKVFLWYQMLMDKGLLDFTEEPAAEDNAAVEIEDGFVPAEEADEDSKEEE